MITIIVSVIVSVLLGTISPIASSGLNFLPTQNLFSQIGSQLPKPKLSEINPLESIGNVVPPINLIFDALSQKLNNSGLGGIKDYLQNNTQKEASNLPLEGRLNAQDTLGAISAWDVLGIVKKGFVLTAQILVTVLEIATWGLKAILGLVT